MSTDRYDVLVIGFVVEAKDVLRPFAIEIPEKFHMEDRFNPYTGKKLRDQMKVVDAEEGTEFEVDKKRFDDQDEVFDYLCKKTGAMWSLLNDMIAIEPKCVKKGSLKLDGKLMARVCEDASQIRTLFKKNWGIELEEPKIQIMET